jgi:hypothetical protein
MVSIIGIKNKMNIFAQNNNTDVFERITKRQYKSLCEGKSPYLSNIVIEKQNDGSGLTKYDVFLEM